MILYDVIKKINIKFKPILDKNGHEIHITNFFDFEGTLCSTKKIALEILQKKVEEYENFLNESGDISLLINPQHIQEGDHYTYDIGNEIFEFYILEREVDI